MKKKKIRVVIKKNGEHPQFIFSITIYVGKEKEYFAICDTWDTVKKTLDIQMYER